MEAKPILFVATNLVLQKIEHNLHQHSRSEYEEMKQLACGPRIEQTCEIGVQQSSQSPNQITVL